MASISTDANKNRTIQFVSQDRKRRSLRLGKVPMKVAEEVQRRVEALNAAKITGTALDTDTARWLADVSLDLARKLAKVGLVGPQNRATTLDPFIRDYIGPDRRSWSPAFFERFASGSGVLQARWPRLRRDPADADRFQIHLRGKPLRRPRPGRSRARQYLGRAGRG